ncbi:MAG: Riboflavin kinase [Candidatus Roizmanbacteria bacterium GW2011_GWA2_33_33]|uniref:riboflavin kinase n=2 Tax=Candidatus Roizmaniibacteriota TaxID=1752723 RepID=A0A0G0BAE9_9BACT|nr:MAG: Riboflavin kinase [Candidatus Roizmanbacteria bacterium GW2011_GWA2_33_33]KKP60721.1 MAG: Riboflavin kinase [Candidatus Roizmanbacteria bacterium GW2011_GWC2_34_23]
MKGMIFESTHIKGKGRGKPMGFPTINLEIPENFKLKNGIYAAKVTIENKTFVAALHYGPVPTFGDLQKSLEVYLIGVTPLRQGFAGQADYGLENLDDKIIKVEIIKFLRDIIKFKLVEELVKQIEEDVKKIKLIY